MSLGITDPGFQHSPPAHRILNPTVECRPSSGQTNEPNQATAATADAAKKNRLSSGVRRRAARACKVCHLRKVRCDATERYPCGNCKWSNVECIIRDRRRPGPSAPRSTENASDFLTTKSDETANRPNVTAYGRPGNISDLFMASIDAKSATTVMLEGMGGHVPHLMDQQHISHLPSAEHFDTSCHLPAFIKPLPERIPSEDVAFLHSRRVFDLPSPSLQASLLQGYIECFHPYMPLLDLDEFLSIISARDGRCGQVSLLLYHTVMFAGMAFVDMEHVREAGYLTQKCARKAFFRKVRVLYDFDYEQDSLVLIQSLLVMSFWYENLDEQKDAWHWTGVAVSLAYTIGLHRDPTNTDMLPRRQTLRKRIWWSCFIRDRLIALGLKRATRIKDGDFDVPMLDEKDFDAELLSTVNPMHPGFAFIRDPDSQKVLALLCVAKAKLCVCMGHVLDARDSIDLTKNRLVSTKRSKPMLSPDTSMERVNSCDQELLRWADSLPQCCRSEPLGPTAIESATGTIAIRNLLHIGYCATVLALYSPLLAQSSSLYPHDGLRELQMRARVRVRDAATEITRLVSELRLLRLERYLQTNGITTILPPLIIHLLETNSIPRSQDESTDGIKTCITAIEKVCDMYAATGFALGFFDVALRNSALEIYTLSPNNSVDGGSPPIQILPDGNNQLSKVTEAFLEAPPHLDNVEYPDYLFHPDEFDALPDSIASGSDSDGTELQTSGSLSTATGPTESDSVISGPGSSEPAPDLDFIQQDELGWTSIPVESYEHER